MDLNNESINNVEVQGKITFNYPFYVKILNRKTLYLTILVFLIFYCGPIVLLYGFDVLLKDVMFYFTPVILISGYVILTSIIDQMKQSTMVFNKKGEMVNSKLDDNLLKKILSLEGLSNYNEKSKTIFWDKKKNLLLIMVSFVVAVIISTNNWMKISLTNQITINFLYYPGYNSNPLIAISVLTFLIIGFLLGTLAILNLRLIFSFIYSIVFLDRYVVPVKHQIDVNDKNTELTNYFTIYSYSQEEKSNKILSYNFIEKYNNLSSVIFQIYLLLTLYSSLILIVFLLNQYYNYNNNFSSNLELLGVIQLLILIFIIVVQILAFIFSFFRIQDNLESLQKNIIQNLLEKKNKVLNTIHWSTFDTQQNSSEEVLKLNKLHLLNQFIESESKFSTWFINKSFIISIIILLFQLSFSLLRINADPILSFIKSLIFA